VVISKTYNMRSQESGVRRKNVTFDTIYPILAGEPQMRAIIPTHYSLLKKAHRVADPFGIAFTEKVTNFREFYQEM
jgi:hypothetical protein